MSPNEAKPKPAQGERLSGKVVDMRGLDGCKFLIELPDGKRLQPINLAKEFQVDKLQIRFLATPARGVMSICMAGEIVRVSEVEKSP